jgi:hypothetical protein
VKGVSLWSRNQIISKVTGRKKFLPLETGKGEKYELISNGQERTPVNGMKIIIV